MTFDLRGHIIHPRNFYRMKYHNWKPVLWTTVVLVFFLASSLNSIDESRKMSKGSLNKTKDRSKEQEEYCEQIFELLWRSREGGTLSPPHIPSHTRRAMVKLSMKEKKANIFTDFFSFDIMNKSYQIPENTLLLCTIQRPLLTATCIAT